MPDSFADEIATDLPVALSLPLELRLAFDWMEANGHVEAARDGVRHA